jgi:hypothetical protein
MRVDYYDGCKVGALYCIEWLHSAGVAWLAFVMRPMLSILSSRAAGKLASVRMVASTSLPEQTAVADTELRGLAMECDIGCCVRRFRADLDAANGSPGGGARRLRQEGLRLAGVDPALLRYDGSRHVLSLPCLLTDPPPPPTAGEQRHNVFIRCAHRDDNATSVVFGLLEYCMASHAAALRPLPFLEPVSCDLSVAADGATAPPAAAWRSAPLVLHTYIKEWNHRHGTVTVGAQLCYDACGPGDDPSSEGIGKPRGVCSQGPAAGGVLVVGTGAFRRGAEHHQDRILRASQQL